VTVLAVLGAIVVVLAIGFLVSHNRFVSQKQYLRNAWANVDTELRRRYDLIPNLVETVKAYATHERETLERVVAARTRAFANQGDVADQARDENLLVEALQHLFAVSEAYPELEANESFLELQQELVATENRIQAARRFYNNNVRDYNRRVQSVPSNLVASLFHFDGAEYFEVEALVREAPQARLNDIP
jgi:LemA protein